MSAHQIASPQNYLRYLVEHASEAELLFKSLLIGVTSFFRDPWAFEVLVKQILLPAIREQSPNEVFRVWVPGCATGEEAYSIAILLRESMEELKHHISVQIFATDLDSDSIDVARSGLFPDEIRSDVSEQRLKHFFHREDGRYRIRKELRDWIVFAPHSIVHDPPFTKLNLITCRNLLIYLKPELQRKLLAIFHYSLKSKGCLFLGTSETVGDFHDLFQILDNQAKIYSHLPNVSNYERRLMFPSRRKPLVFDLERTMGISKLGPVAAVGEAVSDMLATCFAPPPSSWIPKERSSMYTAERVFFWNSRRVGRPRISSLWLARA